jgi:hypothetical protein
MIPDDESMIRKEPRPTPPPADPKTLAYLDSLDFRPFTDEW